MAILPDRSECQRCVRRKYSQLTVLIDPKGFQLVTPGLEK